MSAGDPFRGSGSIFSVAALVLVLAQSCFQVDMTTRVQPDGSGQLTMEMSASSALLEMGEGGRMSADDLQFSEEEIQEMRTAADTMPGIHFDTAYSTREGSRTGLYVQFSFDSVAAVQNVLQRRGSDRFSFPTLRQSGRSLRLAYVPDPELASEAAGEGPFGEMGRKMILQMLDIRFRYVFPAGTLVDTASPAVQRTDSTLVYEWGMREILDASEREDSLFVAATLPESGSNLGLWLMLGAVLIVGGGIVIMLLGREG